MKSISSSNHHARVKYWTALMYSLSLARVTSASPASPASVSLAFAVAEPTATPDELRLLSSNSTASNNGDEENTSRVFNYYLIIVALVAILFCVIVFFIQHRKKSVMALTAENVESASCRDMTSVQMATVSDFVPDVFRVNRNRADILPEGLGEHGEAPPPYVPNFKITSAEQVNGSSATSPRNEATSSNQNMSSTEPPPYNEYMINPQIENSGDIGQARPLPLTNTETSGNL